MFKNIGNKIKTLASIYTWVGIIFSVILGLVLMAISGGLGFLGFIIVVVGSISSWVGSFLLYGFGELVDNLRIIAQKAIIDYPETNINTCQDKVQQTSDYESEQDHKRRGKCEMCCTEGVTITEAVIVDDLGTRYRNVCSDCFKKYNCKPKKN